MMRGVETQDRKMKWILAGISLLVLLLLLMARVPYAQAGTDGSNISPETAIELTAGQAVSTSMDFANDADWYKITVDHTCSLMSTVTNNSGSVRYALLNSNLNQLEWTWFNSGTGQHPYQLYL